MNGSRDNGSKIRVIKNEEVPKSAKEVSVLLDSAPQGEVVRFSYFSTFCPGSQIGREVKDFSCFFHHISKSSILPTPFVSLLKSTNLS